MGRVIKLDMVPDYAPAGSKGGKLKVAGYARVSTEQEEQLNSVKTQEAYFEKLIKANAEWEFAGIYADEGVTGTSYVRRDAFNRMIADALDGKINLILTKSLSRFARNTVDTLNIIRELKAHNVVVFFERENIRTDDSKGEFLITLLSSLAQEEARSISENVRWGCQKRFEQGKCWIAYSSFLGYEKGENKFEMVVNQEQAVTVRKIYRLFLQGYTAHAIADILTKEKAMTPTGMDVWSATVVHSILTNEKYKGDALLQKYYISDFLTKKEKKNKGELPQFYVTGDHEAIISPLLFDYVQEQIQSRNEGGRYSGVRLFSSKLICGDCGAHFGSRSWHSTTYNDLVWQCGNRHKNGCKAVPHIYDSFLPLSCNAAMKSLLRTHNAVIRELMETIVQVLHPDEGKTKAINSRLIGIRNRKIENIVCDMDGFAIIIKRIVVTADRHMRFEFIDGSTSDYTMPRYSPRMGIRN